MIEYRIRGFFAAACALLVLASSSAAGDLCAGVVVVDNGPPDGCNGVISHIGFDNTLPPDNLPDSPPTRASDDFTVSQATEINAIVWYALEGSIDWDQGVRVEVWRDTNNNCLPDQQMLSQEYGPGFPGGGVVTRTVVIGDDHGPLFRDRVRYELSDITISLSAGKHFLVLAPISDFPAGDASLWESSRCVPRDPAVVGCGASFESEKSPWTLAQGGGATALDLNFMLLRCPNGGNACRGDLAGSGGGGPDGVVNLFDLLSLLSQWGSSGPADIAGNGTSTADGVVNLFDLLALLSLWGECNLQLINDEIVNSIFVVGEGQTTVVRSGATPSASPSSTCGSAGTPDVWFCYQSDCAEQIRITVDAQTFIAVYDGSAGCGIVPSSGAQIACGSGAAAFNSVQGGRYVIRLRSSAVSIAIMTIACEDILDNDQCADALMITTGMTVTENLVTASLDFAVPTNSLAIEGPGRWYSVIGDGTVLTASTCFSGSMNTNPRVHVFCNGCDDLNLIGESDTAACGVSGGQASVQWCSAPGQEYRILVSLSASQPGGSTGQVHFGVTSAGFACTPVGAEAECFGPAGSVCDFSTKSNCQFRSTGVYRYSDTNPAASYRVAENVVPLGSSITGLCWQGIYVSTGVPAECDPPLDNFTLRIYGDTNGLPGALLQTVPLINVERAFTGVVLSIGVDVLLYEYSVTGLAIPVTSGACRWIEIRNATSGTCAWAWAPSQGGDNRTAQDPGAAGWDENDLVERDRVLCLNVALGNPGSTCSSTPSTLCDNPSACQMRAGTNWAASDASFGSGIRVLDNFRPASGNITEICWLGTYLQFSPSFGCTPASDNFTIRIYANNSGAPGALLQTVTPAPVTRVDTGEDHIFQPGNVSASIHEYRATGINISVVPGGCYWLEIQNAAAATCYWFWAPSMGGDNQSRQGSNPTTAGVITNDRAFCVNSGLGNVTVCP